MEIELNTSEIGKLLKSEDVKKMLDSYADDIKSKAGTEYSSDSKLMSTRYVASVYTEASADEIENLTLLRCL